MLVSTSTSVTLKLRFYSSKMASLRNEWPLLTEFRPRRVIKIPLRNIYSYITLIKSFHSWGPSPPWQNWADASRGFAVLHLCKKQYSKMSSSSENGQAKIQIQERGREKGKKGLTSVFPAGVQIARLRLTFLQSAATFVQGTEKESWNVTNMAEKKRCNRARGEDGK